MEKQSTRVRLNLKQNAKGQVSFEVTAESPSPEESKVMLEAAIDNVVLVAKNKGFRFVDEV